MIEKGTSIHKKSIKQIIEVDSTTERVNFLDIRFYKRKEKYYPSVTSILQYFPKGKFFEDWLKQVGYNADIIIKKSADEGTATHSLIEQYLEGKELAWLDDRGNALYPLNVWKMFLKFVDFWETHKPTLVESEIHLFSDKHEFAGTCDLVVEINNEKWILDIKTSNSLHTSYDLQLAAYSESRNELYEEKIDRIGILWLKSSKHGPDKSGKKIQGRGWELYESPRSIKENFELFTKVYDLFKLENPNNKPVLEDFPYKIKLKS